MDWVKEAVREEGYALLPGLLPSEEAERLRDAVERARASLSPGGGSGSLRNLFRLCPEVRETALSAAVRTPVEAVLGPGAFPVRAILFDKTPEANWKVGWHQDLVIPVRQQAEAPGFSGWSRKEGVAHCHPPPAVLEGMLTLRLHLDDCGPENGPLRVLPGSHAAGKLEPADIRAWKARVPPAACLLPAGGAVLMRPLLLHASSAMTAPGHRRVVHLEFAAGALPGGLEWPG